MLLHLGIIFIFIFCFFSGLPAQTLKPNFQQQQYFPGTPNELTVYRVYGSKPGKTLMIIGGIQGDEAGAFLSADLYADLALLQGNLIVVPRANLYSIILNNRGPDGDMNRQFGDSVTAARHKQIVDILKNLMSQSDVLLNLHEGSGFYRPTWESDLANPRRYGQCIIADTDIYTKADGSVLNLAAMAEDVLRTVNAQIENPQHQMLFNNHRTAHLDSLHQEQRLSATYYALTNCQIPAFGVEASKSIDDLSLKVHYHHLVINAFMDYLDIQPQTPALYLPKPELHYLVIKINDEDQLRVVAKGGELKVNPGDRVSVEDIVGNYNRGFYCSFLGMGTINDLGKSYVINNPTRIVVRKDNTQIGEIKVVFNNGRSPAATPPVVYEQAVGLSLPSQQAKPYLLLEWEGQPYFLSHEQTIKLVEGDKLVLVDMLGLNLPSRANLEVNVKGYVPPDKPNTGDDRGYVIDTGKNLMPRYGKTVPGGMLYQVVISQGKRELATMNLLISPPQWEYLLVMGDNGHPQLILPQQDLLCPQGARLKIMDVKTNLRGKLDFILLLPDNQRLELVDNTIDSGLLQSAWQNGHSVKLAWLRAGSGQVLGQVNLVHKED